MELIAQTRTKLGKKSKNLKYEQKIPAVIFGKGMDSLSISVDTLKFLKTYREAGETSLVTLKLGAGSESVLIKDVQFDPVKSNPIHASFHKVNLKEKIEANIPIHVVGDDVNPILKTGEGLVLVLLNEITVEALPTDLPHAFEVDVSKLGVGEGITVSELQYNKGKVEIINVEPNELIVKIGTAQMVEEVEEVVDEALAVAGIEATEEVVKEESEDEAGVGNIEKKDKGGKSDRGKEKK